ncbi:TPA: hypothetical protein ACKP36_004393 [Serratia marcescens]|uniref:hypothetical protein n=1 Tax=Serratia marcescens TaxID=615 RepID=UPI00301CF3A3
MRLNKLILTSIGVVVVLACVMKANAAMSDIVTREASVDIGTSAEPVALTITPIPQVAGVLADYVTLAYVTVIPPLPTDTVALQWTPGFGTPGHKAYIITYPGDNNPQHSLTLDFEQCVNTDPAHSTHTGWFLAMQPGELVNCHLTTEGEQNIMADTYRVHLDAGVWVE